MRSGGYHALDLDIGDRLGVHRLPVTAQSDGASGRDHHGEAGLQPAALHQLHGSGNSGRRAGAGCRGGVPAARWELADYPEYTWIAATGLCGSCTDAISLWLSLSGLLYLSFLLSVLGR